MAGDWMPVWLEITGREKPKKIMSEWNYALRIATETLQLDWWEHRTGQRVVHRGNSLRSPVYNFIRATMDGVVHETGEPINAKHVSSWTKEARTWTVDKYLWQIIHEIVVLMPPTMRGWISLIVGEQEPEHIPINADPVSLDKLVEAETEFWGYVTRDEPPDPHHPSIAPVALWETMRTVSMVGNNAWSDWAGVWLENRTAAKRHYEAADELKLLVEKDVRLAHGHGVKCTRDRGGRLSLRENSGHG